MRTMVFIDASNLFYGGEKSLGWKIDYRKLLHYLKNRYGAKKIYYFGGVAAREIRKFAGARFTDFEYLKMLLRMKEKYAKK